MNYKIVMPVVTDETLILTSLPQHILLSWFDSVYRAGALLIFFSNPKKKKKKK